MVKDNAQHAHSVCHSLRSEGRMRGFMRPCFSQADTTPVKVTSTMLTSLWCLVNLQIVQVGFSTNRGSRTRPQPSVCGSVAPTTRRLSGIIPHNYDGAPI